MNGKNLSNLVTLIEQLSLSVSLSFWHRVLCPCPCPCPCVSVCTCLCVRACVHSCAHWQVHYHTRLSTFCTSKQLSVRSHRNFWKRSAQEPSPAQHAAPLYLTQRLNLIPALGASRQVSEKKLKNKYFIICCLTFSVSLPLFPLSLSLSLSHTHTHHTHTHTHTNTPGLAAAHRTEYSVITRACVSTLPPSIETTLDIA